MRYPTYEVTLAHPDTGEKDEVFSVYIDLMLDEADALMRWTGQTWNEWLAGTQKNDPDSLRFLYWLGRKRAGDPVEGKFSDITFWLHALTVDVSDPGDFGDTSDEPIVMTGADPTEGVETAST